MSESATTVAETALRELLDVSPQVDAAIITTRSTSSPSVIAFAPHEARNRADRLADTCAQMLKQAEQARVELGREPITQCEVATGDGHVFVVADAHHIVAAVTKSDPTVGLVFYDVKTALRAVREAASSDRGDGTSGTDTDTESTKERAHG